MTDNRPQKRVDAIHRRMMDEKRKHGDYTDWTMICAHKLAGDYISKQRVRDAIEMIHTLCCIKYHGDMRDWKELLEKELGL